MGNKQNFQIDARQPRQVLQEEIIDPQFEQFCKNAFSKAAVNGKLKHHKFQEALGVLEDLNMITLRDTPMGSRLFFVIDQKKQGEITVEDLYLILSQLMTDKEKRILFTFKVYDNYGQNRITRKDFNQFMEESWTGAFRIMGEQLKLLNTGIHLNQINAFAVNNVHIVTQQSNLLFTQYDTKQNGFLDFPTFRQFVLADQFNEMVASLDKTIVRVPLTLLTLKK